jgi:two-component system, chemotaxis family, sensor kinase CheA
MTWLIRYLILPPTITSFEQRYLARINRVALWFFAAHVPFLMVVAWANQTGPLAAALAAAAGLGGPLLATKALPNPRLQSVVFGVSAMLMGALLVHFGRGLWTIEMHFYFFVALALLAVFANPLVIVVAAVTVALHHLVLWAVAPGDIFNYAAPLSSVLVHASFVVVESVAACFVARSFFDNVIGLERIVEARTAQLDARTREMGLIFSHVHQGLATAQLSGVVNAERSRAIDLWFGAPHDGETVWAWVRRTDVTFANWVEAGWSQVIEDVMPRDVALAMLPTRLTAGARSLEVSWQAVEQDGVLRQVLLVVSDVTERLRREAADVVQRELMEVFDRLSRDRAGFLEFFDEARTLVQSLQKDALSATEQRRLVHTLKGNCALFGFTSVATVCDEVETRGSETTAAPFEPSDLALVCAAWSAAAARAVRYLDEGRAVIELDESDYVSIVRAINDGAPRAQVIELIESWKFEPVRKRFERLGDQAKRLARRLNRGDVTILTEDHDMRLPREAFSRLFSVLPHVVRNAVDHGLEPVERRTKPDPWIKFSCVRDMDELVLSIADNGVGINWNAVAQRATDFGYRSSDSDLHRALFADGLTTRTQATDVSGRGVGMAAVKEACEAMGGRVVIESAPGEGTCVSLRVPLRQ